MELQKFITKNDAIRMLEITRLSLSCKSEADYQKLFSKLRNLILFDCAAIGQIDFASFSYENMTKTSINAGYPSEYLASYVKNNYHAIDPLFQRFIKTGETQYSKGLKKYKKDKFKPLFDLNMDFGFNDNLFIGNPDNLELGSFTAMSMAGEKIEYNQRTQTIIEFLTPYFSLAIERIAPNSFKKYEFHLTDRELEVLQWLKEGKTAWEISMILHISERGVIFHVNNILKKLNAGNRAHAVAIALENNLISL